MNNPIDSTKSTSLANTDQSAKIDADASKADKKVVHISSSTKRLDEWSQKLSAVGEHRDKRKFAELFEHFAPLLRGFCKSNVMVGQSAEAIEEIVQETMLKVWRKAGNYDPHKAAANTWIFTVLRNTRIDYMRKNSRHLAADNDLEADDIWDDALDHQPLQGLQASRDQRDVKQMLADIPPEQAQCVRKVYMEGKSHTEIASELQLPLGTVKSRVRLGLKRIQSNIGNNSGR